MKTVPLVFLVVVAVTSASVPTRQDLSTVLCPLFLGGSPLCPASSCTEFAEKRVWPFRDGLYWLRNNHINELGYCVDTIVPSSSRGWMRVGYISSFSGCPSGLEPFTAGSRKLCRKTVDYGCSSVTLHVNRMTYSKVCGQVYGYSFFTVDGFEKYGICQECTIDQPYMDGVSITYGSPRKHIWTLAASSFSPSTQCPCSDHSKVTVPSFVGNDYYCDAEGSGTYAWNDRLWDGRDCSTGGKRCCERAGWFCKELPEPTNEDIELRLCTDQSRTDEDVYLDYAAIYVQ